MLPVLSISQPTSVQGSKIDPNQEAGLTRQFEPSPVTAMSALGQKRTFYVAVRESALTPKADIGVAM